jgi:succinate dehydrogenase / fumarate reductase cytochrome b subunit
MISRPLSPHLGIYKYQITMVLSVFHRGTGIFLALGTPLLIYWLYTLQAGESVYYEGQSFFSHWLVHLALMGWTFSIFYHLCNGIRHLAWDIGKGYEISDLYKTGVAVVAASLVLTLATLLLAWRAGGLI